MRNRTPKREALQKSMRAVIAEKFENVYCCSGCGVPRFQPSHLVSIATALYLIDKAENIEPHCQECHLNWESGRFWLLENGLELMERLWSDLGPEGKTFFWQKLFQYEENRELWGWSEFFDPQEHRLQ